MINYLNYNQNMWLNSFQEYITLKVWQFSMMKRVELCYQWKYDAIIVAQDGAHEWWEVNIQFYIKIPI